MEEKEKRREKQLVATSSAERLHDSRGLWGPPPPRSPDSSNCVAVMRSYLAAGFAGRLRCAPRRARKVVLAVFAVVRVWPLSAPRRHRPRPHARKRRRPPESHAARPSAPRTHGGGCTPSTSVYAGGCDPALQPCTGGHEKAPSSASASCLV